MATDTSRLSPADAAVALRSFPRRFASVLSEPEEREEGAPDADELIHRMGPDGRSVADHVGHAVAVLHTFERAVLEVTRADDTPVLHPALGSPQQLSTDVEGSSAADLAQQVDAAANSFAETVVRVDGARWARSGRLANAGGSVEALDLLRRAVALVADDLREAQRVRQDVI